MSPGEFSEDTLVQQTTAEYLEKKLGWESVYAYNNEDYGPGSLLGRTSDKEVVLTRILRAQLEKLNPGKPETAYTEVIRQITAISATQSLLSINREKDALIRGWINVTYRNPKGEKVDDKLRVIDFDTPDNNHFLCVRELWVKGDLYRRRADIIGFVNGLPLVFLELKNLSKSVKSAYEKNYRDYLDTVPHLFHHNAIIVLANGIEAKLGSLSAKYEHFHEWKRLDEDEPGVVDMETMLKGVMSKKNLIDLLENFILFDDSTGETKKILARNHQVLGVNRAVKALQERKQRQGKLGVFWHTQGSGKSYSMVLFTRKVHRRLGGNFTFLILTDRDDLDTQIYKTFAGCGLVNHEKVSCRASSGEHLSRLLALQQTHIFSLIQKFNQVVDPQKPYNHREDIIVISDEAHRTQYGTLALNMRSALPRASYIGFTGTPLIKSAEDQITRDVFGDYVSTYDFKRAIDDGATVPLYYDARGDKLGLAIGDLNDRLAEKVAELEIENVDVQLKLEQALARDYHVLTAEKRLAQVAQDFVTHYTRDWENGKAMVVCIDKITCVRMYKLVKTEWDKRIKELEKQVRHCFDDQEEQFLRRQIAWMNETQMAVVISEEQGEVDKFNKWNLDIKTHRSLMKEGIDLPEAMRILPQYQGKQRLDLDDAFKVAGHPLRVVFVCAMWLTGFDVPCLSTLYLDKPLRAHTLMQAIARANRVHEGKINGLVVDYCGILKSLRGALATFAGRKGEDPEKPNDPIPPSEELLHKLTDAIHQVRVFLAEGGVKLEEVEARSGFERNGAFFAAKEVANRSDETRKQFEVLCRNVFSTFKACFRVIQAREGLTAFRSDRDAIHVIYESLQKDRENADISAHLKSLQAVVDAAIDIQPDQVAEGREPYDISRIDFDRLKREFERKKSKHTVVQNLKTALEKRLERMLGQNELRIDFQKKYEDIVTAYNREKDRLTIEQTFEELLRFVEDLSQEETRAVREGLDEETLVVFDLLTKPGLTAKETKAIKSLSAELLRTLKSKKLRVDHWQEKESTRDAVKQAIHDFLWSDRTGLPLSHYNESDVSVRSEEVYRHIYRVYPTLPSPFYDQKGVA